MLYQHLCCHRILPNEDEEVSEYAKAEFEKQGIKFQLNTKVEKITKSKNFVIIDTIDKEKNINLDLNQEENNN